MEYLDAVVVGAGFGGIYLIHKLRSQGFKVKGVEAGSDIGGVWYWNNYPGARVDVDFFIYQYSNPEIFQDFDFTERFPGRDDVIRYFQHVEKKLNLKKDIQFNTLVTEANFDPKNNQWEVKSSTGITWNTRFLFLCTGYAFKSYIPEIKGIENFKGEIYHTSQWPKDKQVEVQGKHVGVIGTGASGVQVIQEVGPVAAHLTIFQRTPNTAMAMRQCALPNSKLPSKAEMPELFEKSKSAFTGIAQDFIKQNGSELTVSERRKIYEELWNQGGFSLWLGNFQDLLTSKETKYEIYAFWAEKVRSRISNEQKRDILAPLTPVHPFGTKQPSLEQNFYEICDKNNVDIIDVTSNPIQEFTPEGLLKTSDGSLRKFDLLVMATGFDCLTGSVKNIRIQNAQGRLLTEKWEEEGTSTLFGMAVAEFPNLFFVYGPQAPTAFSNGPRSAELQGEWLTRLLLKMRADHSSRCEVKKEPERKWVQHVHETWNKTLLTEAKSWYIGANIPGKKKEVLTYAGGMPEYARIIKECEENNYEEFIFT